MRTIVVAALILLISVISLGYALGVSCPVGNITGAGNGSCITSGICSENCTCPNKENYTTSCACMNSTACTLNNCTYNNGTCLSNASCAQSCPSSGAAKGMPCKVNRSSKLMCGKA